MQVLRRDGRRLGHSMRWPLGFVLTLAAATSCANPPASSTAPPDANAGVHASGPAEVNGNAGDETTAPSPRGAAIDDARVQEEAARILAAVAAARELKVLRPVDVQVASKADVRAYAQENMYEHITSDELALQGRIEASLGVIPIGSDVEAILLDLLEDGVLGFYEPKKKTLFIGDYVSTGMLSTVVGHEIAHGLQDQHFDLEKRMEPMKHRSDAEEAQRFLIEGGAEAARMAWAAGEDGLQAVDGAVLDVMVSQSLQMAGAMSEHPVLARSLHLPYAAGTATVIRVVVADGWNAVDAMYDELPTTTEQMLHIEKLRAREPARPVEIDHDGVGAALGKTVVWHDQLGEAMLLTMLADVESASVARRSAAGWGGDAMVALESEGTNTSVVAAVAWDSREDAEQFEASVQKYADANLGDDALVQRRKDVVLLVTQAPPGLDLNAVWSAVTVERAPRSSRRSR